MMLPFTGLGDVPMALDEQQPLVTKNEHSLTDWSKEPTLSELKADVEGSNNSHNAQVQQIDTWLDFLHTKGAGAAPKIKNKSQVQPKTIRQQAEWRYASLSEPFLSSSDIFELKPVTWEDRNAAIQNGLLLNNQLNTRIDKQHLVDTMVRCAVDTGVAFLKVGWKRETKMSKRMVPQYELTSNPEYLPIMQELDALKAESPSQYYEVDEGYRLAHETYETDGIPYAPFQVGMIEEEFEEVLANHPTLEVVSHKNVIVDPSCNGVLENAGFVVHKFLSSQADLKKDGRYKNLDKIKADQSSPLSEPDYAVNAKDKTFNFADKARTKFVVYEYWGFRDVHGKGDLTPFVAAWAGDVLIRMEENPFPDNAIPFVAIPYLPVFESVYGESDGSLLIENQKTIGAVQRGMIDVLAKSANGQTGIAKGALDAVNQRKFEEGRDYQFNPGNDPRTAIHTHTFQELPTSAWQMVQSQNQQAEAMTGVQAFSAGLSGSSLGDTATGVRGALDAASKRELGILRRMAAGVVKAGRKIIAMNAVFLEDREVIRVTNQSFVDIRRDDLPGNFDISLAISTAEEDNAKAQELSFMLQTVGPNAGWGVTSLILSDIARLRKMPDLAKKIADYQPEPDPIAQAKAQLEVALLQAQIATEQAKAAHYATGAQLASVKQGTEVAKANALNASADKTNLDFLEQESGVAQERNLQSLDRQAEGQARLQAVQSVIRQQEASQMNKPSAT
jgi:hypothetical protein